MTTDNEVREALEAAKHWSGFDGVRVWCSPACGWMDRADNFGEAKAKWGAHVLRALSASPPAGGEERTVTRFEVIDHRSDSDAFGRRLTLYGAMKVTLSPQDGGRTLKVFLDGAGSGTPTGSGHTP